MRATQAVSTGEQGAAVNIDYDSGHKAIAHEFEGERSDIFGLANASDEGTFAQLQTSRHARRRAFPHRRAYQLCRRNHVDPNGRKFDGKGAPQRFNRCVYGSKTCQPRRGTAAQIPEKSVMEPLERICA